MARTNVVSIDPEKFELAILRSGKNMHEMSEYSGHTKNYCCECKKKRHITKAFLVFLESIGIKYDDIKPDPEPEPVIETPEESSNDITLNETVTISIKDMSEIISVAIYTAFMNLHKDGVI